MLSYWLSGALSADLRSLLQANEDAGESLLMQPLLTGLPPALRGLCIPPAAASPAAEGRKPRAAAEAEAEEDHIDATPAQHDAHDAFDASGDMPDLPMGECHFRASSASRFTGILQYAQHCILLFLSLQLHGVLEEHRCLASTCS